MPPPTAFRPIPHALAERARLRWDEVELATTPTDQLRALYLAHCEAQDALGIVRANEAAAISSQQMQPLPAGINTGENL